MRIRTRRAHALRSIILNPNALAARLSSSAVLSPLPPPLPPPSSFPFAPLGGHALRLRPTPADALRPALPATSFFLPQFPSPLPAHIFTLTFLFYYFCNGRGAQTYHFFHRPGPSPARSVSSISPLARLLPPACSLAPHTRVSLPTGKACLRCRKRKMVSISPSAYRSVPTPTSLLPSSSALRRREARLRTVRPRQEGRRLRVR